MLLFSVQRETLLVMIVLVSLQSFVMIRDVRASLSL